MNSKSLPEPNSDSDRRMLGHIRELGWAVIGIPADAAGPTYSFSVGMVHSFEHPEILIAGQPIEKAKILINELGERIRIGEKFLPGTQLDGIFPGLPAKLLQVLPRYYREYLGSAIWINGGKDFDVIQLAWSDKYGTFPWEDGFEPKLIGTQIILGAVEGFPLGWPFPEPPTLSTYVARSIVDNKATIRVAYHDSNSDWQFMADPDSVPSNGQYMALSEVVQRFPELMELSTLPPNSRAIRNGDRWVVEELKPSQQAQL